jgi:hypothetical protein
MKRIVAVLTLAGAATIGIGAPAAMAADSSACLHLSINVNGTEQTIDQCAP